MSDTILSSSHVSRMENKINLLLNHGIIFSKSKEYKKIRILRFIIFLNHVQKEIFYCNYNNSVFKKEIIRNDYLSINSEHSIRLVFCSLILVTCLIACYRGYSKNKKAPRHPYPTCNKCASTLSCGCVYHACVCVYLYIHTRTHFLRGCGDQNEQSSFLTLTLAQWFSHSLLFSPPIEVCLRLWHHIHLRKVTSNKTILLKNIIYLRHKHTDLSNEICR